MLCYHLSVTNKCPEDDILYHFPEVEGVKISRAKQYGRHFEENNFKRIFVDENCCIFIQYSSKFAPNDAIYDLIFGSCNSSVLNRCQALTS